MNSEFIHRLIENVEQNMANENFGPEELADKMGMSHSGLHRKLKDISNQTISQFIREVRLKKAKDLLLTEEITVSEIAYKVGFGSPTYFNKCFHEQFGVAPGEFKKQELEKEPLTEPENLLPKKKFQKVFLFVVTPILIFASVFLFLNEKYSILDSNSREKSIAVLPFKFFGKNQDKQYMADGTMDAILVHLSKIKDLRVISGTSVEQYRLTDKTAKIIGKELNVAHLLEGNFHQLGDNYKLTLHLINTVDESLVWSENYDWNIAETFAIQSKAAQKIASELNAEITPEEKQRIEKIPTISLTAYDFYLKGRDEYQKYWFDNSNRKALEMAEEYYNKALNYDSAFALAYTGIAQIYRDKNYYKEYFTENFLDSVIFLANRALSFNDQLAEAYNLRGIYYYEKGDFKSANTEFDTALKFNPNLWEAYFNKGKLYWYEGEEHELAIFNFHEALLIYRGPSLPKLFQNIARSYLYSDFFEQADYYFREALSIDQDSALFLNYLANLETEKRNYNKAIQLGTKAFQYDSTNFEILNLLGFNYAMVNEHKESLKYYKKMYEILQRQKALNINNMHRIGYAYFKNGNNDEANFFFHEQIKFCKETIELERPYSIAYWAYYDLAGVYAFLGEREKSIECLRIFKQRKNVNIVIMRLINDDPLLNNIRNDPEFQQIKNDIEKKYLAEHERVKKWLEEHELL